MRTPNNNIFAFQDWKNARFLFKDESFARINRPHGSSFVNVIGAKGGVTHKERIKNSIKGAIWRITAARRPFMEIG
ncbi:hypothetical protein ADN00_17890 [Ornatilinea apprima]|uniref:Uncharacterized protein n=1 Tax=Ornatilinea apprima TaxID=1134406 RepID=A0A0P6XPA0_9CHLR|nr:hypothetical protein ADN00_17890 [Ornatilinea apprima]